MTTFLTLIAILQSFSVSLGVGASTLAIVSFFVAIADGSIDDTERKMMGLVYIILRIAMVMILFTSLLLFAHHYTTTGFSDLSAFSLGQMIVIVVLFINAMLMTAHLIPSTFGPAIQAGSWYTLGTLAALVPLRLTNFTLTQFFLGYVAWIVLAISVVNGVMAWQMAKRNKFVK